MPIIWYLCPYDVTKEALGVVRRPAISRYIPTFPDPNGSVWDEAETLGNALVVKVSAPDPVHATIQADPDFVVIPHLDATIPLAQRATLRVRLIALGFSNDELEATGWAATALLARLTSARTVFQRNAAGNGIDILPGRRTPGKTVTDIDRRLPG